MMKAGNRVAPAQDRSASKNEFVKQKSIAKITFIAQKSTTDAQLKRRNGTVHGQEYYEKRQTIIFLFILGLIFIGGGSAMTWWGATSLVKDMLIIGPGCIIFGTAFVSIAVAFAIKAFHAKNKLEKLARIQKEADKSGTEHLQEEYFIPQTVLEGHLPVEVIPSGDHLYGSSQQNDQPAKKHSPKKTSVEDYPQVLKKPVVSFPTSIAEENQETPTYKVVIDNPVHKHTSSEDKLDPIQDDEVSQTEDKPIIEETYENENKPQFYLPSDGIAQGEESAQNIYTDNEPQLSCPVVALPSEDNSTEGTTVVTKTIPLKELGKAEKNLKNRPDSGYVPDSPDLPEPAVYNEC